MGLSYFLQDPTLLFLWVFGAVVVSILAKNRNRDGFGWFLLSFVISPFLAFVLVLVLRPAPPKRKVGFLQSTANLPPLEKKCPRCAEEVKYEAKVCRYCGHEFEDKTAPSAKPKAPGAIEDVYNGVRYRLEPDYTVRAEGHRFRNLEKFRAWVDARDQNEEPVKRLEPPKGW